MSGPLRSILPIAVVLVSLVAMAVVVALVAAPSEPDEFPPGSPEGAVQRYLRAIQDRDIDLAYGMLASSVRDDLSREDFWRFTPAGGSRDQVQRIRIDAVDATDERATVHVTVDRVTGSGINTSRYSSQHTIVLVREQGEWMIDDPIIPIARAGGIDATGA